MTPRTPAPAWRTAARALPVPPRAAPAIARWLLLALCVLLAGVRPSHAAQEEKERLLVDDPYVELRTGPGRGYPVFYVVPRHEWIEVEMSHTDWYKVRTESGREGWIDRHQLENTLTEAGGRKTFRDVLLEDYLKRRLEFGAGWGHYASEPFLKLWEAYNITDAFASELTFGQVQGQYSGTDFWHLDLLMQPWSEQRVQPFFGIGVGRIDYAPNASLVGATPVNANMADAMIGVRYHVSDRLIVRLDWSADTSLISTTKTQQFRVIAAGLSFFF